MIDAIIFDFDGTLADTRDRQFQWYKHWSAMSERDYLGYFTNYFNAVKDLEQKLSDVDADELSNSLKDNPGEKIPITSFEEFLPIYNTIINKGSVQFVYDSFNLPCNMSDHAHPVWFAFNDFNIRHPAPLFAGIKEAVDEIWHIARLPKKAEYNKQIRMAINTTNSWKGIYSNLEKYGILNYFDSHVCSEDLKEYDGSGNAKAINKPSKVSVALSLLLLDAPGDTTIFVGDTLADLGACIDVRRNGLTYKKENLITVGCTWGYDGRDVLTKGVSTGNGQEYFKHLIDEPAQLVGLVKEYTADRHS